MLTITNLTKKFGALVAVDNISLTIPDGEIFVCIGPNGSGKTTTIKMIAGLYLPTSGDIFVKDVSLLKRPEEAKKFIGYVPDEPFIYEKMSGREFLGFVGTLYRMTAKDVATEAEGKLLPLFPGLCEVIDGYVEHYSRGNRQKLAFVSALMHHPKLFLIDEPMVGLDPQSAHTVKQLLKDYARDGGSVFLCTHTLPIAEELASRVGILDGGRLVAVDTLTKLREATENPSANLEEIYLELTKTAEK